MMQLNSFYSMLKAEHYKTKRNSGILLILLFPLLITIFVDIYLIYKYSDVHQYAYNPWTTLLGRYIFSFYAFLYPLILAIFCYSFCEIEYKHNSIKQLFTLPVSKQKIFFAKITLLIEIVLISVLIGYFLFLLSGYFMSYLLPEYNFQNYDSRLIIATFFFKMFLASTAIVLIQFFLSLTFNNFTVPVGIACFGVVFMLVAGNWKYIDLVPYSFISKNNSDFFQGSTKIMNKIELISLLYILFFIISSYWSFISLTKKKI